MGFFKLDSARNQNFCSGDQKNREFKMDASLSDIYKREENKKLLFVYAMAKRDINISKIYLDKTQNTSLDIYERDANIIALYITYGRIFSKNFDLPKLDISHLNCQLTEDEENLHKSLKHSRDKIFAHSDASMNNIQVNLNSDGKLITTPSHNTTLIEKYHEVGSSLFEKILAAIDKKLNELLKNLYSADNGYKITNKNFVLLGYSNNIWEKYLDRK